MKMTLDEKKLLYAFGTDNRQATIERLALLSSITVENGAKTEACNLHNRLTVEITESDYKCLYPIVRSQMRLYGDAETIMARVENESADLFCNVNQR